MTEKRTERFCVQINGVYDNGDWITIFELVFPNEDRARMFHAMAMAAITQAHPSGIANIDGMMVFTDKFVAMSLCIYQNDDDREVDAFSPPTTAMH